MFCAFYVGDLERMMADTFPHLPHLGFLLYVGTNVAVWSLGGRREVGIFDSSVTVTHQSQCFRLSRLVDNPDLGTIKSFPFPGPCVGTVTRVLGGMRLILCHRGSSSGEGRMS